MKVICAALCLLLPVSLAHAQTAGEMLRSCEILQRGAHTEGGAVFLPPGVDARPNYQVHPRKEGFDFPA